MAKGRSHCLPVDRRLDLLEQQVNAINQANAVIVHDEGVLVTGAAHTLDFVGALVEAALASPGVVRITITGGAGSQDVFPTIAITAVGGGAVAGDSSIVADSPTDTLTLDAGPNITLTGAAGTDTIRISVAGINVFHEINPSSGDTVAASSVATTLNIIGTGGITVTGNNSTKTLEIDGSGVSGGGGGSGAIVLGTLDADLQFSDSTVTVNVEHYQGSNPGATITGNNVPSTITDAGNVFAGNEGGACLLFQATDDSNWYFMWVEPPTEMPV